MAKIPKFKTEEEEAEFWDTHDSTDYLDDMEDAEVILGPELEARILERSRQKRHISLRLENRQINAAKAIADRKGLPYQTLMRMWIQEAINREGMR